MTCFHEKEKKVIKIVLFSNENGTIISNFLEVNSECYGSLGSPWTVTYSEITIGKKKEEIVLYIEDLSLTQNSLKFEPITKDPDAIFFIYDYAVEDTLNTFKKIYINDIKIRYPQSLVAIAVINKKRDGKEPEIKKDINEFVQRNEIFSYEIDPDNNISLGFLFFDMIDKIQKIKRENGKNCFRSDCFDSCLIV